MTKQPDHIPAQKFLDELRRYQKGSVTRRHFLGVTGLGLATAVLSSAVPGLRPRKAHAARRPMLQYAWRAGSSAVEQRSFKPTVVGSIPTRPTKLGRHPMGGVLCCFTRDGMQHRKALM